MFTLRPSLSFIMVAETVRGREAICCLDVEGMLRSGVPAFLIQLESCICLDNKEPSRLLVAIFLNKLIDQIIIL